MTQPDARKTGPIPGIIQNLRVVFRTMQEHSRWVEGQCGVTAAQLWAMGELHAQPGMRVSDLSKALSLHQSTTSNMLDKLEKKRLVERHRGGPDQRVVKVLLTERGRGVVENAPQPAQGAITDALLRLPAAEVDRLEAGLAAMVSAMVIKDRRAALEHMSETDTPDTQEKDRE